VRVWPSDANFFLAEFRDPDDALTRARQANLLIREIRAQVGLPRSLRVSIGSKDQNERLLGALR
jgi:histidinol-phosphate aminotransferase